MGFLKSSIYFWKGLLRDHFEGPGTLLGRLLEVLGEAFGGPGALSENTMEVLGLCWRCFWDLGIVLEIILEVLGLSWEPLRI